MFMQGTREWTDYGVSATLTPQVAKSFGLAVRVQGLGRYYALLLGQDCTVRLIKVQDGTTVLQRSSFEWQFGSSYKFALSVEGATLRASLDNTFLFEVSDEGTVLTGGGIALICEEGLVSCPEIAIGPA